MLKIPKLRWVIAAMLFLATMINYVDRTALSVVSVDVRRRFQSESAGLLAHPDPVFYRLRDHVRGFGLCRRPLGNQGWLRGLYALAWSIAQMLHAFAVGKWSLGAFRFLLGLAEPGNWPAAAKAVADWFPARERALGIGIFNAGSSIGSAIAPPMVAWITFNTAGERRLFLPARLESSGWFAG